MSFGGFGGFGSNNQQNQQNQSSTGFGGFGASTNTTGGFGTNTNTNTGTGFGASTTGNTGGSLFGGNTSTGGFGSGGGFGSNTATSSPFGAAKPAFGATTTSNTGSLFGGGNTTNTTSGFGGFGTNNNTSTGFGGSGTTATAGQNKPAFGASTTGGSLFGGGTTGGFGSGSGTTGGFGGFGQQNQAQSQAQNTGTAATPFAPHQEKDTASNNTSLYQSITFQPPYSNYSFEELRVADYNAGRRYGNTNGQAGAFGQTTGFGGFGSSTTNTTGGFGSNTANTGSVFGGGNNATSSPFGQSQQPASTGFGGGGGLFGNNNNQAKPAGGLFGSTPAASGTTSGGLFGSAAPATGSTGFGGFGSNNNNNTASSTGGGLFGSNNNQNQTQNKPFGGFGSNTNTTTTGFGAGNTTGGFGSQNNTNTGGGLFGSTAPATSSPFGGAQQQNQTAGGSAFGGFGSNNNNQQNSTGGSLFGGGFGSNNNNQNQQKPGGLFGNTSTTTGGGLFGNNQTQQPQQNQSGGGLFGNTQNNQQSGGLFGSKPATTGGLFGNTQTNNTSSGGLFGNTNQNQNTGGGLFGSTNNQQKPGGLFGSSTTTNNTGGGLFGGLNQSTNQNQSGGGLFGGSQNNQNAGNSLFGGSQQNQQPQQQNQGLMASLLQNPYGNDQLFANLGTPSPSVGPIATPLSGANKQKRPSLPAFKINASQSMRLITPQKRSNAYGFSYSTYGTPGSAQSFTPGRNSLLGSGSIGRPLSKSLSTSNLRTSLSAEDSILAPGAFTPNARPYSSGSSVRRLKIDRSLRTDLFGSDGIADRPSKRVSFDGAGANGVKESQANGDSTNGTSNALVRTETDGPEPSSEELGLLRAPRQQPKDSRSNGTTSRPEMEQVRGNELAMVPEDEVSASESRPATRKTPRSQADQEPGEYYISPSLQELRDMPREKLKSVRGFTVGRVGIGKIEFDEVDMSAVPLDRILGDIVKLNVRSATVYETGVNTPPEGKGLNVPSTITLENSWPRSHGGRLPVHDNKGMRYDKHIERLKRVTNTEFISYNPETGEWVFRVPHFTTYGLDDDDDDDETMMDPTEATTGQGTPRAQQPPAQSSDATGVSADASMMSPEFSDPDDTFDFKKGNKKSLPGGFGDQSVLEDDEMDEDVTHEDEGSDMEAEGSLDDPFVDHDHADHNNALVTIHDSEEEQEMAGSFPENNMPKSILKPGAFGGTPVKAKFDMNDDWAEQLQRTLSPKKQDRRALREQQNNIFENGGIPTASIMKQSTTKRPFNTTMDIMNSLWAQPKNASIRGRGVTPGGKGFEWPYDRNTHPDLDLANMNESDQAFHDSVKPTWTPNGTLVYAIAGNAPPVDDDLMMNVGKSVVAEGKDIRFAKIKAPEDTDTQSLRVQLSQPHTTITAGQEDIPCATISKSLSFAMLAERSKDAQHRIAQHEQQVWQLASVLFDPLEVSCTELIKRVPKQQVSELESKIRRDAVCHLWANLCNTKACMQARDCHTLEEKALNYLSGYDIESACAALVEAGDFRLATIISQLSGDDTSKQMMQKQIEAWRSQNVLSEMSPAIRALYEIAAGNACVSEGKSGAAEDRAPTFAIAERFGFDWKQAFGLRLWYCKNDLVSAVQSYTQDVQEGKEKIGPAPTFGQESGWDDGKSGERENPLVALLRLYVAAQSNGNVKLSARDLFDPAAVSGNPINARIAWQLATSLRAQNVVDADTLSDATVDDLTVSLAAQLENLGTDDSIVSAVAVLLHLSSAKAREAYVKDLLSRRAPSLPNIDTHSSTATNTIFNTLTTTLHIPSSWIHRALALHAASTANYHSQVSHLLAAGDLSSAHDVLCTAVGPSAIITQEYDTLRELLGTFMGDSGISPDIANWRVGGAVYFDFIHLIDIAGPHGDEGEAREEKHKILKRLGAALPGMRETKGSGTLEERVAVAEMAEVVKREVVRLGKEEKVMSDERLRRLPVVDDAYVKQGVKVAGLYYRAIGVQ